jgi:AcrR family transcriptional regulator
MEARPRDAVRTRELILATARKSFAVHGYDRATVRTIAADAGVSANLITRYFGGKQGLFAAATAVDMEIEQKLQGPVECLGARIADHVVSRWESPAGDDPLLILLRAAMTDPVAAAHMADFFRRQAVVPLSRYLGGTDAAEKAAAVSSLIMGTVIQRYVLGVGPLAATTADGVRNWLGTALQLLLTGGDFPPLDGPSPAGPPQGG